jgi:uncharacterized integral membrane protein
MKRILRWVVICVVVLVLGLFVGFNLQSVKLVFWPTDFTIEMPLSVTILCAAGIAFLFGGLVVWTGALRQRHQLRRAEENVRLLEEQIRALKARPDPNQALPPPAA